MYRQIIKKVIKPQNTIADIHRLSSSSGYYKPNVYEPLYSSWSKKQLKNYRNQIIIIIAYIDLIKTKYRSRSVFLLIIRQR